MTQKEFTYLASETRAKAVSIAQRFGYAQDDAEDIAQDVMLRLWSLHEQINDAAHLKASAAITTKCVCIDKWRTTHQHTEIAGTIPFNPIERTAFSMRKNGSNYEKKPFFLKRVPETPEMNNWHIFCC